MSKIKLIIHYLPWELDYALLNFTQLKKSKYYLEKDDHVKISTCLNLSDYIINWEKSKLPKHFFEEKYKQLQNLLVDYEHDHLIYEGDRLYGHLDFQRESIEKEINYYISACPNMYFSETLLKHLIDASKLTKNKYVVITPEISKLWDHTWDEITNQYCTENDYKDWNKVDIFQIRNQTKGLETYLEKINKSKFAGWFDLYSKSFFEELSPIEKSWSGYGGYDHYSMVIADFAKGRGVDYQQYVIRNQVIFKYSVGPLIEGFSFYYKNLLHLNNILNQRAEWEKNFPKYIQEGIERIKNKF